MTPIDDLVKAIQIAVNFSIALSREAETRDGLSWPGSLMLISLSDPLRISNCETMKAWHFQFSPKNPLGRAIITALLLLTLASAVCTTIVATSNASRRKVLVYKGKHFDRLFYGTLTNFFDRKQTEAHVAVLALGTNAFGFLYGHVTENRASGVRYLKAYRALPPWFQKRIPFPILEDDIKERAWEWLEWMHDLSDEQVEQLCASVVATANPRVRLCALESLAPLYGTYPAYFALCKKLLDDPHPGIRLKAAIRLAQWPKQFQEPEPKQFGILAESLKHRETRTLLIDTSFYSFGQIPPGGTNTLRRADLDNQDVALRITVLQAINGLKVVTPEQIEELRGIFARDADH